MTGQKKASVSIWPKFCKEKGVKGQSLFPFLGGGAVEGRIEALDLETKKMVAEIACWPPISISSSCFSNRSLNFNWPHGCPE